MSNRDQNYRTTTLTNTAESANNTETVVCTLSGVTCEYPNQTVRLNGWLKATTGTGTTSGLIRVRRTSLTGTSVGEATPETQAWVASKTGELAIECDDAPGELAGAVYVLTYVGAGDTAVATFLACSLSAQIF